VRDERFVRQCYFRFFFVSKRKADNETEWELEERLKVRCIWLTGQKGLTEFEAAVLIVQEAQKLLADDLLHMGIEWKPAGWYLLEYSDMLLVERQSYFNIPVLVYIEHYVVLRASSVIT
jgi:hypothetical protein